VHKRFFTRDLATSWVKITSIFEWSVVSIGAIFNFQHFHECTNSTVQFLREVGVLYLGCEFFKISNNVDVLLITNSTESSFSFTFRRGHGKEESEFFVHS
jgi:uncharacterized protein YjlB